MTGWSLDTKTWSQAKWTMTEDIISAYGSYPTCHVNLPYIINIGLFKCIFQHLFFYPRLPELNKSCSTLCSKLLRPMRIGACRQALAAGHGHSEDFDFQDPGRQSGTASPVVFEGERRSVGGLESWMLEACLGYGRLVS